jgi:hypothetical protein
MRHKRYRAVDACLLQPQARRILAACTPEGESQGGDDAMRYDVIVMGTGSARSVLVARLSEDSHRSVLLLEAGSDYPNFEHLPDDLKLGNNFWLSAYGPHNWGYVATVTP